MYVPSDPKIWEGVAQDKLIRQPRFLWPIAVTALMVFGMLVKAASWLVPPIGTWSARSYVPARTGVLFSLCWLFLPYYLFIILRHKPYEQDVINKRKKPGWTMYLRSLLLIFMTVLFFSIHFYFALPVIKNCTSECIHESLYLQLFYGFALTIAVAYFLAMIIWWMKHFRLLHTGKIGPADGQPANHEPG